MTGEQPSITGQQPAVLHYCGENIATEPPAHMADGWQSSLSVWVEKEPPGSEVDGRISVAIGFHDGDTPEPNMWELLTPENADKLASLLRHHSAIAVRETQTGP